MSERKRIRIDLNARDSSNLVPVKFDLTELPVAGEWVTVYEPDDKVEAPALVAAIEVITGSALLRVSWDEIRGY